jgi:CRP/FNR family cyclic AMP-dependent transcriptional regulator
MTPATYPRVRRPVRARVEAVLAATSLFRGLEDAELDEVARLTEPFELRAGELLFRQGERAEQLYVLEAGHMDVTARLPGDREMLRSRVGAGDVLGELSLVAGGKRTASARAVETTRGLLINQDAFRRLRMSLRPAGAAVMRRLCGLVCARLRARCEALGAPPAQTDEVKAPDGIRALSGGDLAHLERLDFFAGLGGRLPELASRGARLDVDRGTLLVTAGTRPDRFLVTLRGAVEATVEQGATRQRMRLAGPGRAPAYLGLLDGAPSPVACRAREAAQLFALSRADFADLIDGHDLLSRVFVHAVAEDLAAYLVQAERRQARILSGNDSRPAAARHLR